MMDEAKPIWTGRVVSAIARLDWEVSFESENGSELVINWLTPAGVVRLRAFLADRVA